MPHSNKPTLSWQRLFTLTILAIYFYVFMEWLFFVTKPSFMDTMPFGKKLEVFLLTGLVPTLLALACLVVLRLLGLLPGPTRKFQVFQLIGAVLPAFFAAALSLLLLENFTYTIFKFGIITSRGYTRGAYAMLLVVLCGVWYWKIFQNLRIRPSGVPDGQQPASKIPLPVSQTIQHWLGIALIAFSLVLVTLRVLGGSKLAGPESSLIQRQPHIILLGGEGVIAEHMSLYGYARDTTPNLRKLAKTGLLAENNYTNAAHTTGSVISMLTGKYPTQTRLLYSPNILHGEDAYQHLPGILRRAGYATVEISFPYYLDAYDLNMQQAFDEVNGRSLGQDEIDDFTRRFHFEDAGYFLRGLFDRIANRLLHIFYVREMPDPYHQVIQPVNPNQQPQLSDVKRIRNLIHELVNADRPLFIHVHLMDTHGGMFYPRKQVFSAGKEQFQEWIPDFYDDAVLDFDAYIAELISALSKNDLMDQMVLVVYSDHADQWRTDDRLPLLFHFPQGEYAGRIANNTQNLDIAPTLLDYLGMEQPAWMPGQSLLRGEPAATRPIISAGVVGVDCDRPGWWCIIDQKLIKPPYYQFGYIQMVVCQKMYTLYLNTNRLSQTNVKGHTDPCPQESLPDKTQVRAIILDHLRLYGFDVSALK